MTTGEWEVPEDDPLQTVPSAGAYHRESAGALTVCGQLSCKWEIEKVALADGRAGFQVTDLASTSCAVVDVNRTEDPKVAQWHVDVGDLTAPGPHLHMQVAWPSRAASLDIPRFPVFWVLPTDSLEFMIADLFQEDWEKNADHQNARMALAKFQRRRLQKTLGWFLAVVDRDRRTPWVAMRAARPIASDGLF